MQRPLPPITLLPLDDAEYAEFAAHQVLETARQHVLAGEWTADEAPARSRSELADLLAGSLHGTGHLFLKAVNDQHKRVGWIHIAPAPEFVEAPRERKRWLAQITVEEPFRRCGHGRAMLTALHARLAAEGVEELWLRVYDWNDAARRLYAWAGYELARQFSTDAHLRKRM